MAPTRRQLANMFDLMGEFGQAGVNLIKMNNQNQIDDLNTQMASLYSNYQVEQQQNPEDESVFNKYESQVSELTRGANLLPAYSRALQNQVSQTLAAQRADFKRSQFSALAKRGISTTFSQLTTDMSNPVTDSAALKAQIQAAYVKGQDRLVGTNFLQDYEYNEAFSKLVDTSVSFQAKNYINGLSVQLANANMSLEDIEKTLNDKANDYLSMVGKMDASPTIETSNLINKDQDDSTKLKLSDEARVDVSKYISSCVSGIQKMKEERLGEYKNKLILDWNLNGLGSFLDSSECYDYLDQDTHNEWIMQYLSLLERGKDGTKKEQDRLTEDYKLKDLELIQAGATPETRLQLNLKYTGLGADPDALTVKYREITDTSFGKNWEVQGIQDKLAELTKPDKNGKRKMDQGQAAAIMYNVSQFYQNYPDAKPGALTEFTNNQIAQKTEKQRQDAIQTAVNPGWRKWFDGLGISSMEGYQQLIEGGKVAVMINADGTMMTPNAEAVSDSQITQTLMLAKSLKLSDDQMKAQLYPRIITVKTQSVDDKNPDQSTRSGQTIIDDHKNGFSYRYHMGKGKVMEKQIYNLKTKQWENWNKKKTYQSWQADPGRKGWENMTWEQHRDAWGTK